MDLIGKAVDEFVRLNKEHTEKTLAEIIEHYDFIVGSMECKSKLMEALPDGAKIAYSPYIIDPNMIYVIKKFDIMDLLKEENLCNSCKLKDCWLRQRFGVAKHYCVHYEAESEEQKW